MHDRAQKPTDYRSITLLNDDYKVLARILERRLRPLLTDHLRRTGQHDLRLCRDRAGRHRAIGDNAHPTMRAVSGFSR